jgi:hypothetical protein
MDSLVTWFWASGTHLILYVLAVSFALYTTKEVIALPLKEKISEWQYRSRLRIIKTENEFKTKRIEHPFFRHIYLLIKATSSTKSNGDVAAFYVVTSLLSGFTFVVAFLKFQDWIGALLIAACIGAIPYLSLQMKLRIVRNSVSDEILTIIQTITQQYSANSYDIYYALVESYKEIENRELRRVFTRLISELQVSRNEDQLREVIEIFVYSSNSNWAKRLGSILLKAYLTNENVLNALLVLSRQVEQTQEMLEEEKSQSMDSVANGFITVPIFVGSIGLGYYTSGAQDWFNLQFDNNYALSLFVASLIGVIFSVFISLILKKPKNDL